MPPEPARVKALFLAALDLPDPADRPPFLDRECGDDTNLRRRLDELLDAHDRPLDEVRRPLVAGLEGTTAFELGSEPPAEPDASERPDALGPDALIGTVVAGRYKLRQEIGEGGMGSVYLAEQLQPVRRMVALKLIKPGMDTRTVLARFDSERQALALMDHPHIARVLDAGSTEQGRPFFVMELVKGIPITEYCDRHRLGMPDRLALFRQVCSAVQHAHQKGIIHRDLKPTNILVEAHDDRPVPKVIDFGLAKATSGAKLTEQSLFTAFGSVAGTPAVHGAGAGQLQRPGRRHPGRHLCAGRGPLRAADRLDADPPRDGPAGGARRDAPGDPRGRAADAVEPDQHLRRAARPGGQPPHRARPPEPIRAGRPRLDRDEGPGQGATSAV